MNCVSTMTLSKTTTDEHDLLCGNIPLSQWGQNSPHTQLWGLAVQSLHSSLFSLHFLLSQSLSQTYSRKDFLSIERKISIEYPAKISWFFF